MIRRIINSKADEDFPLGIISNIVSNREFVSVTTIGDLMKTLLSCLAAKKRELTPERASR